ncbi:MAG: hypothetical protein HN348_01975 [Proteobacteria bacterium]|nr:hypothetical protein [Pseudomonadota bacterium]
MRSTLVSDAHLSGLDDPNQAALVEFLETWPTDEWVLVGDIFDVWWGFDRAVFSAFIPVLGAFWRLTRRGVRVVVVPGNHDFYAGPALPELGVDVLNPWARVDGGLRIIAAHGDVADDRARQRILTRAFQSRATALAIELLGPSVSWRAMRRVSNWSRTDRKEPHCPELMRLQARWVDQRLGSEADVVCIGHSHAPGIEERPQGMLVNIGDWMHHRSFAVVDDGIELYRWKDGKHTPLSGPPERRPWARS